jgi:hypothetical protein
VLQENVALAVAVEVAGLDNRPAGGQGSNPGGRDLRDRDLIFLFLVNSLRVLA